MRRRMTLLRVVLVITIGSGLLETLSAGIVLASCVPTPPRTNDGQSYYAGTAYNPGTAPTGIKANIEEYSPWMGTNSQVQQWVMLTKPGRWVQVGWRTLRDGSGNYTRYSWWQWTDNSGATFDGYYTAAPIGTSPLYRVEYLFNPDLGVWQFKTYRDTLNLSSHTIWTGPTNIQVYGETNTRPDQMPGGTANHNLFTNAYYRTSGSWTAMSSGPGATDSTIHGATRAGTTYDIWDKGCSS